MKKELDDKLVEKYPKIFADRYADKMTTAMCWGIDCYDGWYDIINGLCESIQNYIDNNPSVQQVVATQVKEKFGGLCFYYKGGDDNIFNMVRLSENESYKICEFCGSKENVGRTTGWIYTICEDCYNESIEDRIKNLKWKKI